MKKNLSRAAAAVALSAALLSLAGCQTAAKNAVQELDAQDAVTIQLVCQSEDVYQIFYSTPGGRGVRPGRLGGFGRQSPHPRDVPDSLL